MIQQTKKQSDLEKRLQILRHQVYGKESKILSPGSTGSPQITNIYLRQDLLKIFFLSSLAIGIQITLFFLLRNNVLSLKLF